MEQLRSGRIDDFKKFSNFGDIKSFNNNVEMFLAEHKKDFSKGELIAFKRLVRYCAKIKGVANAKIATLVKACVDTLGGISRSTFERMLRKSKKLGILSVHNTYRQKKGGKGHNIFVFNKFDVSKSTNIEVSQNRETRYWTSIDSSISEYETNNLLKANNTSNNKRNEPLTKEFTSDSVPKEFTQLAGNYYNEAAMIEEFWKAATIATKYCDYMNEKDKLEIASDSFRQAVRAYKVGNIKKSIIAFYWGVMNRKIDSVEKEAHAELGSIDETLEDDNFWPVLNFSV